MHECDACGLIFGGTDGCPSCGSMVSHPTPEHETEGQVNPPGSLPGGVQLQESMEGVDGLESHANKESSEGTDLPFQLGGSSGGSTSLPFGMGSPSGGLTEAGESPDESIAQPEPAPPVAENEEESEIVHLEVEEPVVLVAHIEEEQPSISTQVAPRLLISRLLPTVIWTSQLMLSIRSLCQIRTLSRRMHSSRMKSR